MKKIFVVLLVCLFATAAFAGNTTVSVTGYPSNVKQGATGTFMINVSSTTALNITEHPIAIVSISPEYWIHVVNGSVVVTPQGTPQQVVFHAKTTVAEGCETDKDSECKKVQELLDGAGSSFPGSVHVDADVPVGTYTVTLAGKGDQQMGLADPMGSFQIEVVIAGHAPTVTINTPETGSNHLFGEQIDATVTVLSDAGDPTVEGCYNLDAQAVCSGVALNYDGDDTWKGTFTANKTCSNTFRAVATNTAGSGEATSTFNVHYAFSAFLPPVTTAKFQKGRTLPVKFRVSDANGFTATATATVKVGNTVVGSADVYYDELGQPYYEKSVILNGPVGATTISVDLNDCYGGNETNRSISIMVK